MCEHLADLDKELKYSGIKELSRGQPWSNNCREWVYYDCVLDLDSIRQRFNLPDFVTNHSNEDAKTGLEAGLYCEKYQDAVIGAHPGSALGKKHFK